MQSLFVQRQILGAELQKIDLNGKRGIRRKGEFA
jgi:hypothetical protein